VNYKLDLIIANSANKQISETQDKKVSCSKESTMEILKLSKSLQRTMLTLGNFDRATAGEIAAANGRLTANECSFLNQLV
jgi:hypothetical protein